MATPAAGAAPTPTNRPAARPLGRTVTALGRPGRIYALAIGLERTAPTEVRLFKAGANETTKGTFYFTEASAALVMEAAARWGNEHSADYEHAALTGAPEGAPAAAWYDLEVRAGEDGPELWAVNVRWTDRARGMIEADEYRYISPAFYSDANGQITAYVNFALTNTPATIAMQPLIAASRMVELGLPISDLVDAVQAQLHPHAAATGWPVDVETDRVVIEAGDGRTYAVGFAFDADTETVTVTSDPVEVHRAWVPATSSDAETGEPHDPPAPPERTNRMELTLATIAVMLGMTTETGSDAKRVERAINALKAKADTADRLTALVPEGADALGTITAWRDAAGKVEALTARITELEQAAATRETEDLLEQAARDGKVTPATRTVLAEAFAGNVTGLRSYLAAAPRIVPTSSLREPIAGTPKGEGAARPDTRGKTWADLSNMERHALRMTDPEEFERLHAEHQRTRA